MASLRAKRGNPGLKLTRSATLNPGGGGNTHWIATSPAAPRNDAVRVRCARADGKQHPDTLDSRQMLDRMFGGSASDGELGPLVKMDFGLRRNDE